MIIRRFSLLWEDVLWQVLNICSNDLSPHFTTNLRWHFSSLKCFWRYFGLITPYSTSEFITSEHSGIKVSACLWSPTSPYLSSKAKPTHHKFCTAPGAHWAPSAPSREPSLSLVVSLVRQTQPGTPTFTGSQSELRSPAQGQWFELSSCYPLMAWTENIQHVQFSTWPTPFSFLPFHCSPDAEKPKQH